MPNIIRNLNSRRLRWVGDVARTEKFRNGYRVSVGKPEGMSPLRSPSRRWEYNIKMNFKEVGCNARDWIDLTEDRDQ